MPRILIKSGAGAASTANVVDSELAFNRTKGTISIGKGSAAGQAATEVVEMARHDHVHGNLSNTGTIGSAAGLVVRTTAGGAVDTLPSGTEGQVLRQGASGIEWGSAGGVGTVTSVGLSMPSLFTVTGTPVTDSGTLTANLATQAANQVLAGPTGGSAAAPGFRALVSADLPDIDGGTY